MMKKFLEKYLLPVAMVVGIVFHEQLATLSFVTPYLLSFMLFITYCRVSWNQIRLTRFHYILLFIQYGGSVLTYLLIRPFSEIVAQAMMICVLTATATSASVVTGILGGGVANAATYTIISNLLVAFIAPLFLSVIGNTQGIPFTELFWYIFRKVMPILIVPFVAALLLSKISPKAHLKVRLAQIASFYLWVVALTIVLGNVTQFVIAQFDGSYTVEIIIAVSTLMLCILQFVFGRKIGSRFNETIAGGQSLGQKNTILAIWLTQTYLNPIASLGPGLYVLWQNMVNSWQIWRKNRKE